MYRMALCEDKANFSLEPENICHILFDKLAELLGQLPKGQFIRCHQAFVKYLRDL